MPQWDFLQVHCIWKRCTLSKTVSVGAEDIRQSKACLCRRRREDLATSREQNLPRYDFNHEFGRADLPKFAAIRGHEGIWCFPAQNLSNTYERSSHQCNQKVRSYWELNTKPPKHDPNSKKMLQSHRRKDKGFHLEKQSLIPPFKRSRLLTLYIQSMVQASSASSRLPYNLTLELAISSARAGVQRHSENGTSTQQPKIVPCSSRTKGFQLTRFIQLTTSYTGTSWPWTLNPKACKPAGSLHRLK